MNKKLVIGLLFVAGLSTLARASCMGPFCFDGTGGNSIQGGVTLVGAETNLAPTINTPTSVTGVTATSQPVPTASYVTYMSTGGNLLMSGLPSIATATVVGGANALPDGQLLTIGSTATISYTFRDNASLSGSRIQLQRSQTTAVVSSTQTLNLMYSAPATMWLQL